MRSAHLHLVCVEFRTATKGRGGVVIEIQSCSGGSCGWMEQIHTIKETVFNLRDSTPLTFRAQLPYDQLWLNFCSVFFSEPARDSVDSGWRSMS